MPLEFKFRVLAFEPVRDGVASSLLELQIKKLGYDVSMVATLHKGLELLRVREHAPDILICDVLKRSNDDAFDIVRAAVKQCGASVRSIVLTSSMFGERESLIQIFGGVQGLESIVTEHGVALLRIPVRLEDVSHAIEESASLRETRT